jgi:hypothetical protein
METISEEEVEYLINNINTGIEFEYALFYELIPNEHKNYYLKNVIEKHISKDRIIEIITNTDYPKLNSILKANSWFNCIVYLATQVDDIGPADIILEKENKEKLGISIKFQNNCTLNVSSKYFLTDDSLSKLKNELNESCQNYINAMSSNYGDANNWFRKRKLSKETDNYIDKIRDKIINEWSTKTNEEKKELLTKLTHADSPISFYVLKYIKTKNGFKIEVNTEPVQISNPDSVELVKVSGAYIGFKSNDIVFAKMQVKFNNGILERADGIKIDFTVDGINMKKGDPFGSWNFNI